MYTLLSTNIDSVKERGLEAKSSEISVAVLTSDIEQGIENPTFYAYRYGMIYNPRDEFKPNVVGGQRIKGQLVQDYIDQLETAKTEYKRRLMARNSGGNNSDEIDMLRGEMKKIMIAFEASQSEITRKETRIKEQTEQMNKIAAELEALKTDKKESDEINRLKKELEAKQAEIAALKSGNSGEITHEKMPIIIDLLQEKEAVYLYGDAGTGKSRIAEQAAKILKLDFYPASTITQEFKLTGYKDGNGVYHETNFYKAAKYGGLFFIDEMDSCSSDVLVGINGILASGYFDFPNETVYIHENFRVIAAGNTIGRGGNENYTGRQPLDISTLDRFMVLEIDYSPAIDNEVARGDVDLVNFAHAVRNASKESGITILMSYRSISKIIKFIDKFDLVEIMKMAVIKGMASDDVKMLSRNMNIDSSNKYYKAFKQAA